MSVRIYKLVEMEIIYSDKITKKYKICYVLVETIIQRENINSIIIQICHRISYHKN